MRALAPALAAEGLDARRFALLARRVRRAEAAIEFAVAAAAAALSPGAWSERGPIVLEAEGFAALPAEVALRLLGQAIARVGDEGPVQLGKLESLADALAAAASTAGVRFRRTLAGAAVTLGRDRIPRCGTAREAKKPDLTGNSKINGMQAFRLAAERVAPTLAHRTPVFGD